MNLLAKAIAFGIAGFDPTGAIVIITALTMGLSKKQILLFAITTFIGTVFIGVGCSTFLGTSVNMISNLLNSIPDIVYMWLELIIGVVLLKWFVERVFFKSKNDVKEEKKESFFARYMKKGLFVVGILFAVTALADPSFLALITISGHNQNMIYVVLANCIWILISQLPIFVLTIAVLFNKHEKVIEYFRNKLSKSKKIEKIKKVLSNLLSTIILLIGILSIVDSIYYWFNSSWLF